LGILLSYVLCDYKNPAGNALPAGVIFLNYLTGFDTNPVKPENPTQNSHPPPFFSRHRDGDAGGTQKTLALG
jgi:hypothetical protein